MKGAIDETLTTGTIIHRQAEPKKRSTLFHRVSRFRFWVGVIILVPIFGVFIAFETGFLAAYVVISGSMEPTLQINDCVIVHTTNHAIPRRGDIVAFKDPIRDLPAAVGGINSIFHSGRPVGSDINIHEVSCTICANIA